MTAIKLPISFDGTRLREDLRRISEGDWQRHYKKVHYEGDWSSVGLVAAEGNASDIRSISGNFVPTAILNHCPYFQEVIASFKCPLQRVRLLRLDAGAVIKPHVDREGVDFGVARFHVPIVTNDGVEFTNAGKKLRMALGECWLLDTSYSHSVRNGGTEPRIHLVLDCVVNDFITDLLGVDLRRGRWLRIVRHRIRYLRFRVIDTFRLIVHDRETFYKVLRSYFYRKPKAA